MLSSKTWMCLLAIGLLTAASTHSMAQSGSRYSNAPIQRAHPQAVQRSYQSDTIVEQAAPAGQARVAQTYVPQHIQNGIQTGVVAAPVQRTAAAPNAEFAMDQPHPRQPVARTAQIISGPPISNYSVGSGTSGTIGPVVGPIVEGPIVEGPIIGGPIVGSHVMVGGSGVSSHSISTGCSTCPTGSCGSGFGGPVDLVGQSYFSGRCNSCGDGRCGGDCCGRGGCPPGPCWLDGLFGAFGGAEFFAGGAGFKSETFQVPGITNEVFDDSSFGVFGGFNLGVPLCRLTCGILSGQIGVRHISSDFDGNNFSTNSRNQTFFTAGVFRRVDYGLQIGVVADVLREDWFTTTQTVQIRGDFAWVYPGGSAFGFRFTDGLEDDTSDGIINGTQFTDLRTSTIDTYRFYYRQGVSSGGYYEVSAGFADEDAYLIAFDHDVPVNQTLSIRSNLTYYSGEDLAINTPFATEGNEAWNVSVGFVWRPSGRRDSYDAPLLPVADNGTFILRRGL